jgi:hypothetical protein
MTDDAILAFRDDFEFLSNFYYAPVRFEGATYATVEHAFQAAKTDDPDERALVRACSTPAKAKARGRRVTLRKDWEAVKLGVMEVLLREKFTWGDVYWGVCRGSGRNHLGRLLMRIRDALRVRGS